MLARFAGLGMLLMLQCTIPSGEAFQLGPSCAPRLRPVRDASATTTVMMAKKKSGSAEKIQVLLAADIEGVGKKDTVVQVNTGYFNNFLRPKGIGKIISDEEVATRDADHKAELERIKQEAMDMAEKIKAMGPLVLKRKVGAGNKIFGTITNKQIIEAVQKATNDGVKLTIKMKMEVPTVEGLGDYQVSVQLHPEVATAFPLKVQEEK